MKMTWDEICQAVCKNGEDWTFEVRIANADYHSVAKTNSIRFDYRSHAPTTGRVIEWLDAVAAAAKKCGMKTVAALHLVTADPDNKDRETAYRIGVFDLRDDYKTELPEMLQQFEQAMQKEQQHRTRIGT